VHSSGINCIFAAMCRALGVSVCASSLCMLALLISGMHTLRAQGVTPADIQRYEIPDTTERAVKQWRTKIRTNEKVDITVYRSFFIDFEQLDTVPINTALSGTLNFSFARNLILSPAGHWVSVIPAFSLTRLEFPSTASKTFPSRQDSIGFERIGVNYLDVSAGLGFLLSREPLSTDSLVYRNISSVEFGFTLGYAFSSFYKVQDNRIGRDALLRISGLDDIQRFRFSAYMRFTYRVLAFYALYRFTPLFLPGRTYQGFTKGVQPTTSYPVLPRLELGIGLHIF
jgi:hypothetical protein